MLKTYTLEKYTPTVVLDDEKQAESAQEALAMAFGGDAKNYHLCINIKGHKDIYFAECNEVFESYVRF